MSASTQKAIEPVEDAAAPPMLHRIVSAGHLRYWIIASWACALLTEAPWPWVAAWFGATMAAGFLRGAVEARARQSGKARGLTSVAVATGACVAWACAPLLAWLNGGPFAGGLAVGLLCAGYTLVYTQLRAAPREALIVSSPYTIVLLIILLDLRGEPGFWTLVALAPVVALALLIKVVITAIRDREIRASDRSQMDLIRQLEQARDQADAASEAKSTFLGVISHELRTPMNGVLGAAQLLEATPLRKQQADYVGVIRRSGESLLGLLNDILDITKVEAGKMEIDRSDIAITDLLERAIGPFRAQAESKGLVFEVESVEPLPTIIRTDPLRVAQIVQNFLGNAIKFTAEGEVRLILSASSVNEQNARLTFTVADQGMGIAPEDLDRLFEPFTQVDASSTRRFGGTGLGLSIARRMARLLDGEVQVRSTLGQGSEFGVTLNVEVVEWRSAECPGEVAPQAITPAERPMTVLVAEDHPVNRMIMVNGLAVLGHQAFLAENGQEALEQAAVQIFDLIIMDVNMPVMDGLEAIRRLRSENGPNRDTPIAVLSASARREDHDRGLEAGADTYLDKPVDFLALSVILHKAQEGRGAFRNEGALDDGAVRSISQPDGS
jgi:signal transduction histidine kinase/CheY-like chemotaxis protein